MGLVLTEEISGINFMRHIADLVGHAVGDNHVRLTLEGFKILDDAGIPHAYLEYGSYFGEWRRRNALKMWTGWPTFPMVFVRGVLVGGASDLAKLVASGELKALLATPRAD